MQCDRIHHSAFISLPTNLESVEFWLTLIFFSLHQMTPLHLAAERNHVKMVECFLDQYAYINIQDDNDVILHTNLVDYIDLAGRCCLNWSFSLPFENNVVSLQAPKLGCGL